MPRRCFFLMVLCLLLAPAAGSAEVERLLMLDKYYEMYAIQRSHYSLFFSVGMIAYW